MPNLPRGIFGLLRSSLLFVVVITDHTSIVKAMTGQRWIIQDGKVIPDPRQEGTGGTVTSNREDLLRGGLLEVLPDNDIVLHNLCPWFTIREVMPLRTVNKFFARPVIFEFMGLFPAPPNVAKPRLEPEWDEAKKAKVLSLVVPDPPNEVKHFPADGQLTQIAPLDPDDRLAKIYTYHQRDRRMLANFLGKVGHTRYLRSFLSNKKCDPNKHDSEQDKQACRNNVYDYLFYDSNLFDEQIRHESGGAYSLSPPSSFFWQENLAFHDVLRHLGHNSRIEWLQFCLVHRRDKLAKGMLRFNRGLDRQLPPCLVCNRVNWGVLPCASYRRRNPDGSSGRCVHSTAQNPRPAFCRNCLENRPDSSSYFKCSFCHHIFCVECHFDTTRRWGAGRCSTEMPDGSSCGNRVCDQCAGQCDFRLSPNHQRLWPKPSNCLDCVQGVPPIYDSEGRPRRPIRYDRDFYAWGSGSGSVHLVYWSFPDHRGPTGMWL